MYSNKMLRFATRASARNAARTITCAGGKRGRTSARSTPAAISAPDQVRNLSGSRAPQNEGGNVLGDRGAEHVAVPRYEPREQVGRQRDRRQPIRSEERRERRETERQPQGRKRRFERRRGGCLGGVALPLLAPGKARERGARQVGGHQPRAERRQTLAIDPDDLQGGQDQDQRPAPLESAGPPRLEQVQRQRQEKHGQAWVATARDGARRRARRRASARTGDAPLGPPNARRYA